MAPKRPAVPQNRTPWHAPYIGSLHLELWDYRESLSIIPEVSLTSEPLVIDGVIIKKDPQAVIEKNLARIFRAYNVVEVKGPESSFSNWDFFKCQAYVYLYSSLEKIPLEDLTLTIIEARYPREFFKYVEERGLNVKEAFAGIYYLEGAAVPTQLIVTGELSELENLYLKNVRRDVNAASLVKIFEKTREKLKDPAVTAYMYALIQANAKGMEEVEKMALTKQDRKVLAEWWFVKEAVETAKRQATVKAKAEARAETKAKIDAQWQNRAAKWQEQKAEWQEKKTEWQEKKTEWQAEIKDLKAQLKAARAGR